MSSLTTDLVVYAEILFFFCTSAQLQFVENSAVNRIRRNSGRSFVFNNVNMDSPSASTTAVVIGHSSLRRYGKSELVSVRLRNTVMARYRTLICLAQCSAGNWD